MTNATFRSVATIIMVSLAAGTTSAVGADIEAGERLALRWCANCHLVKANQPQANADVPSFLAISRTPDFNPERVASFLMNPHPKMPSYALSRSEAGDIAAYIHSLTK